MFGNTGKQRNVNIAFVAGSAWEEATEPGETLPCPLPMGLAGLLRHGIPQGKYYMYAAVLGYALRNDITQDKT